MKFHHFSINSQVQSIGIRFDHVQEYRRAWLSYGIASLTVIFMAAIIFVQNVELLFKNIIPFVANSLVISSSIIIPTSFTILLSNIHKRFVMLNWLLRFVSYLTSCLSFAPLFDIFSHFLFRISFAIRNRFLRKNKLNGSIIEQKERSIRAIKFMGRQFLLLSDIMDQLNSCYSLKVRCFSFDRLKI